MKKLCPACQQAIPEPCGLVIDDDRGEVRYYGLSIALSKAEARILSALVAAPGRCLSKNSLFDAIYFDRPGSEDIEIKIIDVFVCKLRKKLVPLAPAGVAINTLWGRGYELVAPGVVSKSDVATVGASEVADLSYGAR